MADDKTAYPPGQEPMTTTEQPEPTWIEPRLNDVPQISDLVPESERE